MASAPRRSGCRSHSATVAIAASPAAVFAFMDDFRNLGGHMSERSMAMMGSRLRLEQLSADPTGVGARYRWHGRLLGLAIDLTEVVTEWTPDRRKAWQTLGTPKLIVMAGYRMSFTVAPEGAGSALTVEIEYDLPASWFGRVLSWLLGDAYSRWCLRRMCEDTRAVFAPGGRLAKGR